MRILFVGMAQSIHVARWTRQLADQGWDLHLFAVTENPIHVDFRNITVYRLSRHRPAGLHNSVRIVGLWPLSRGAGIVSRLASRFVPSLADRAAWLGLLIRLLKPDIVHSLEFQHAGYLVLEAKAGFGDRFPTWIATNWGSDVYLFGRLSGHREKVKAILRECDYYDCECERDVELAKELGLVGKILPVLPNTGGYDLESVAKLRQAGPTSNRRTILVKGYQGWAYRSLVALRAIELCAESLRGYRIRIYLAENEAVQKKALQVARSTNLPIHLIPYCSHEDMLRLHGSARIHLALNISDAVSTAFLEALVMGAFPIQSCTACADEWVEHGKTGFIVPPEDPEVAAEAIRRAAIDDGLVDRAAEENSRVVAERLDSKKIKPQVVSMYKDVLVDSTQHRHRPTGRISGRSVSSPL